MKIWEIGWFAGLFEGEGHVGAYGAYHSLRITISSSDVDVLEKARAVFGFGSINENRRRDAPLHHKRMYRLQIIARQARQVLQTILPLLGKRRRNAAVKALLADSHREVIRLDEGLASKASNATRVGGSSPSASV